MAKIDLSALQADLGAEINDIQGLQELDQADVGRLQTLLSEAMMQQKQLIEEASEQALTHIPALLRGTVRKLLFR